MSPEAWCMDVCSCIITSVSRNGHDVLSCERQQWWFSQHFCTLCWANSQWCCCVWLGHSNLIFCFSSKESSKLGGMLYKHKSKSTTLSTDLPHWQPSFFVSAVYSITKPAFMSNIVSKLLRLVLRIVESVRELHVVMFLLCKPVCGSCPCIKHWCSVLAYWPEINEGSGWEMR